MPSTTASMTIFTSAFALVVFLGTLKQTEGLIMKSETQCFETNNVYLRCPADTIIRIFNVTYGRSDENTCNYNPDDCSLTEPTSFGCNGRSSCDVSIRGMTRYYVQLPKCRVVGNYIHIIYGCIEVENIADLCADERTDSSAVSGYVAIPSISAGMYTGGLDCMYRIVGSNIRLQLITVNLTDTHDCVEIHNMLSSKTFCGGGVVIENHDIDPVPTNEITVSFASGLAGHRGIVWIYYEMTPLPKRDIRQTVPPALQPTTTLQPLISDWVTLVPKDQGQKSSTTVKPKSWTSYVVKSKQETSESDVNVYNSYSSSIPQSTIVIIALIFGLFAVILVVLFTIYCVKRHKDRSLKRSRLRTVSGGGGGGDHVAWHNITNECLTDIMHKHDTDKSQAYSNDVIGNENYYATVEHSYC